MNRYGFYADKRADVAFLFRALYLNAQPFLLLRGASLMQGIFMAANIFGQRGSPVCRGIRC